MDNTSTADPFIMLQNPDLDIILKTNSKIDENATIEWDINPLVTIINDSINTSLSVYVYDEDTGADDLMGETLINFYDYTTDGAETDKYPTNIVLAADFCVLEFDLSWE